MVCVSGFSQVVVGLGEQTLVQNAADPSMRGRVLSLYGMIGRARGTVADYSYSKAIQAMGGQWGFADLDKFLTKPKAFIAGTKMSFSGLKKAGDRAALILYMRGQADQPATLPN